MATEFSRLTYNAPKLARQVLRWIQVDDKVKQRRSRNGPIKAKSGLDWTTGDHYALRLRRLSASLCIFPNRRRQIGGEPFDLAAQLDFL